jgi:hypothetical protein
MTTTHVATPEAGTAAGTRTLESYLVDKLFVPQSKGQQAFQRYQSTAGGALQTTLTMSGTQVQESALWQERDKTAELKSTWLKPRGVTTDAVADKAWIDAGGQTRFPVTGAGTGQMDHIVELQLGGSGNAENIQPLEGDRNRDSGGALKTQIWGLAHLLAERAPAASRPSQIRLRFTGVDQVATRLAVNLAADTPTAVPGTTPVRKTGTTCLAIAQAMTENLASGATSAPTAAAPGAVATKPYNLVAGGATATMQIPANLAAKGSVDIFDDETNRGAGTLISGLLLKKLIKGASASQPDEVDASLDNDPGRKTRLPISLTGAPNQIKFSVAPQPTGTLKLLNANKALAFTYPYLSPGAITSLSVNDQGGVDWAGYITPSVPFLGRIDVAYKNNELSVSKGVDEETLKKKSLLGAKITGAKISLLLSPEFKPEGRIDFQMGPDKAPLMTGYVTVNKDDTGLVATGKFKLNIPKVDNAEFDITYRAGEGRNDWEATIKIDSTQIHLPYVKSGSLEGHIAKNDISFTGKVNFEISPGNTAEAGFKRQGNDWIFFGGGKFKFPKLDETTVTVLYNTSNETLIATGSTGFTLANLGLTGRLEKVTFVVKPGEDPKVSGTGSMEIKKGKASGKATVTLHENGKFTGKGHIEYQFTENITAGADVELDEKEKLHVAGKLTIKRYELFKGYHDSKELFSIDLTIPIPGLSLGGIVGINAVIGGGVSAGYDFGPGVIEPLIFSAEFDPLESDPNLDLAVEGQVKIPVSATLTANIHAAIQVSVTIAKAEGGLQVDGSIILRGGLDAPFNARYFQKKFEANLTPKLDLELLLRLALSAYVLAQAGFGVFKVQTRADWKLLEKEIPTGLRFVLSAPFGYSSDKGIALPTADQVTLQKPNVDVGALLGRLFGQTQPEQKEV